MCLFVSVSVCVCGRVCVCCSVGSYSQANWLYPSVKVVSYYRSLVSLLSCDLDASCWSMHMYHSRQNECVCMCLCVHLGCFVHCFAPHKICVQDHSLYVYTLFLNCVWEHTWLLLWWAVSSGCVWWMDGRGGSERVSQHALVQRGAGKAHKDVSHSFQCYRTNTSLK